MIENCRFRVAAVYANQDNLRSPTSKKFLLKKGIKLQRPDKGPVLTKLISPNRKKVVLIWDYNSNSTTEGFIIYYRDTTTAKDYIKVN